MMFVNLSLFMQTVLVEIHTLGWGGGVKFTICCSEVLVSPGGVEAVVC